MADEIRVTLPTINYVKGTIGINITPSPNPLLITVTGENSMHDVLSLTTTFVPLSKGNIGTLGWIYVKNLDVTNNIIIAPDAVSSLLLLKPGEYATFRWNPALAFWAKTSAGTATIEYMFIED